MSNLFFWGGEFLLFPHKNIVKILNFFPSVDLTNFPIFGYFPQMFLISQNRRKNPGTNVGVEFPTFYTYKNPSMKDQKEISWRFLETFYDEKNKRVFISLKKVAVWF